MMRKILLIPLAAVAACAVDDRTAELNASDTSDLTMALAGRIEGEPRNCVRQQDVRNSRSAGTNTILFDGPGGVVYLNRASGSCPVIQPWHAIRHRTIGTAVCSGELIRVFDPQVGVEYGGCTLGAFVPWRRAG